MIKYIFKIKLTLNQETMISNIFDVEISIIAQSPLKSKKKYDILISIID